MTAAPPRCFVGLWPDADAAVRLVSLADELGREYPHARRITRANLHLTLAFIGDLESDAAQRVALLLGALPVVPFTWTIDSIGSFAGPRVAWAGGPTRPALQALVDTVRELLTAAQVRFDQRPFVPHVTLLRHLPRTAAGLERPIEPPIAWQAGAPVLLRSLAGRYEEIVSTR
jgi:2'-5' RNA ligase